MVILVIKWIEKEEIIESRPLTYNRGLEVQQLLLVQFFVIKLSSFITLSGEFELPP